MVAGLVGLVQLARRKEPESFVLVGATVMTAAVPLMFFGVLSCSTSLGFSTV